jgi:cytochrome c oxidase subunit 4
MTKEWQEASEEYMKVRTSCLSHCIEYKLIQSKSEKDLPAREKLNDE